MVGKRIILLTLALSMGSTQAVGWADVFSFDTSKLSSALEHGLQKLNENRNSVGAAVATGLVGAALAYYAAKRKPATVVSDVSVATDPVQVPEVAVALVPSESDRLQAEAAAKDSEISGLSAALAAKTEAEQLANNKIRALEAEKSAWLEEQLKLEQEKAALKAALEEAAQLAAARDVELEKVAVSLRAQIEPLQLDLKASAQELLAQKALAESFKAQAADYKKQLDELFPKLAEAAESSASLGELVKQQQAELADFRSRLTTSEDAAARAKTELELVLQRAQSLKAENDELRKEITSLEARYFKLEAELSRYKTDVMEQLKQADIVLKETKCRAALLDSRQLSLDVSAVDISADSGWKLDQSAVVASASDSAVFSPDVSRIDAEASDSDTSWTNSAATKEMTALAVAVAAASVSSSEDESVVEAAAASSGYVNVPFVALSLSAEMQERVGKASPSFSVADAKILNMGDDSYPLILADIGTQKALYWLQQDGKARFGGTKYKLEPFGTEFSAEISILAFKCNDNYLITWVNSAGNLAALVCLSSDKDPAQVYFAEDSNVRLTSSDRVKFEVNQGGTSVNLEIDGSEFVGNYYKDDSSGSAYYYIDKE